MAGPSGHRLLIEDRGANHIHRFTPRCECGGWTGQHRRTRDDAAGSWREHARTVWKQQRGKRRRGRRREPPQPRPVTPLEDLPELLRPSSA